MAEGRKRPVARRTLYLAIEAAIEKYGLTKEDSIEDLLEWIKDEWFKEAYSLTEAK